MYVCYSASYGLLFAPCECIRGALHATHGMSKRQPSQWEKQFQTTKNSATPESGGADSGT